MQVNFPYKIEKICCLPVFFANLEGIKMRIRKKRRVIKRKTMPALIKISQKAMELF